MTLIETLQTVGMDEKEARVYLAGLELGPATVLQLSKKSEVKRPTTYVLLDALCERGYFAKTFKNQRPLYIAERPEALLRQVRSTEQVLAESLPLLHAVMATSKQRPTISIYEGKAGVRQIYSQMLESEAIQLFGSIKEVNRYFSDMIVEVARSSKSKQPMISDIVTNEEDDLRYAKQVMRDNPNYTVRIAPAGFTFLSDCAIYGNRVAIFAVQNNFFAVVIESAEVAHSFRSIHQMAWQSAQEVPQ